MHTMHCYCLDLANMQYRLICSSAQDLMQQKFEMFTIIIALLSINKCTMFTVLLNPYLPTVHEQSMNH